MLDTANLNQENNNMSPSNGKDYKLEIELLKKDVSSISNLYERMDNTIEKIETAASDISKIVIQQEQKIKIQEHINRDLETSLERHTRDSEERSRELNSKIECVDDKIDRVNKELTNKIEQTQSTIVSEMMQGRELLKQEIGKVNDNLNKKIGEIDTWRYMVMGGIALAVFIFSNLIGLAKLFR